MSDAEVKSRFESPPCDQHVAHADQLPHLVWWTAAAMFRVRKSGLRLRICTVYVGFQCDCWKRVRFRNHRLIYDCNLYSYLGGVEERLAKLERRLISLDDGYDEILSSPQRDTRTGKRRRARSEEDGNGSLPSCNSEFSNSEFIIMNDQDSLEATHEDSTDAMGAMVFADEEDSAFFGEF